MTLLGLSDDTEVAVILAFVALVPPFMVAVFGFLVHAFVIGRRDGEVAHTQHVGEDGAPRYANRLALASKLPPDHWYVVLMATSALEVADIDRSMAPADLPGRFGDSCRRLPGRAPTRLAV